MRRRRRIVRTKVFGQPGERPSSIVNAQPSQVVHVDVDGLEA
jgi:hypothetical protein